MFTTWLGRGGQGQGQGGQGQGVIHWVRAAHAHLGGRHLYFRGFTILVVVWEWQLKKRQFQGFPLADYSKCQGFDPWHFDLIWKLPSSAQTTRSGRLFLCWRAKTGGLCHLRFRAAAAAHPPAPAHALQHTLGVARGAVPHAVA